MTDEPMMPSDIEAPEPGELILSHEAAAGVQPGPVERAGPAGAATRSTSSSGATGSSGSGSGSAADTARAAKEGAAEVAGEARTQVAEVAHTAGDELQARWGEMRQDLHHQASQQTDRAGAGLRQLSQQLEALVSGDVDRAGPVAGYARQLQDRVQSMADRVEHQGFDGVVSDLRSFARRRPGAFLAGAAAAGFVAGRMLRSSAGASTGSGPGTGSGNGSAGSQHRYTGGVPATGVRPSRVPPSVLPATDTGVVPTPPGGIDTPTGLPGSGAAGIGGSGAIDDPGLARTVPGDVGAQRGL